MYQPGQLIFYGNSGVYRVEGVEPIRHIRGYDPEKLYYKLSSFHRGDLVYVPLDAPVFMRALMGREEAEALLENGENMGGTPCPSSDPKILREHYQQMFAAHDHRTLVGLIQEVNTKERQAIQAGRRLGKTDQEYKKKAEGLLCEELSAVLDLSLEEAKARLHQTLGRRSLAARTAG
jgi:CarD family transcriptional regulator